MPDTRKRIEDLLDEKTGYYTRNMSWRWELAEHILDAYESGRMEGLSEDQAWQRMIERVGNLEEVGKSLEQIHSLNALEWIGRTVTVGIVLAVLIVVSKAGNPFGFISYWAMLFTLLPCSIGLFSLHLPSETLSPGGALTVLRSRDVHWEGLQPFIRWGSIAGLSLGVAMALSNDDPWTIGPSMAFSLLSALYGLILTTYSRPFLLLIVLICVIHWIRIFMLFSELSNQAWNVGVLWYPLMATCLTFLCGYLFYGRIAFIRRFHQLPVIATLAATIFFLMHFEDGTSILASLVVTLLPLSLWLVPQRWLIERLPWFQTVPKAD